jgi:hypothetical protein
MNPVAIAILAIFWSQPDLPSRFVNMHRVE